MSIVSIKNLGKSYNTYKSEVHRIASWFGFNAGISEEHWILQNISFDIMQGESIGIVGKNGAGKSTLLKMITGTLKPSIGSVNIFGKVSAILELGMGFNPELTGRQNVQHVLGLMGCNHQEIANLIPQIEDFCEIGEYFDQPVRVYSSGMQMRVAFGVATAYRPDLLIIDEALSVGDAYFQAKCYERIRSFKKNGMSIILVSHSVSDIVRHCDKAVFIDNGKLVTQGNPKDVTNKYLASLHIPQIKTHAKPENNIKLSSKQDIFHTRPYYRKEEHRFGEGGAKIIDFLIQTNNDCFPSHIAGGEEATFSFSVEFENHYEKVIPGILIKSIDGFFIYGTNSVLTNNQYCSAKKNECLTFTFQLPLSLNTGHYLISFGISKGYIDSPTPLDRRYDSVLIHVQHSKPFWGLMDFNASFSSMVIS